MPRSDRRLLDLLRQGPRLAELAAFPFDFDLCRADHGEDVRLASGAPLEGIAGDDTGGTYFLCGDGGVLYADSEGHAGLIAESLADTLELVTGLPGWRDHLHLQPETGEEELSAAALEGEDSIRASYAPYLDAHRDELLTALGLTLRPPAELFARMHRALLRTEPDHVLLLADEGSAYHLLGPHPRPPLQEALLGACQADLAHLRADRAAWPIVAFSPVSGRSDPEHDANAARRAGVLRAAQYDRRDTDLPLLRHLLDQETLCRREAPSGGMGEELHLAVFLVARCHCREDLSRLYAARCANFDTWCALSDLPLDRPDKSGEEHLHWDPEALQAWVEALDTPEWFGNDPNSEPVETWVTLARRQGRTELARTALIRMLDDIGPGDTAELPSIVSEFAALGDFRQASRAQRLYASVQDTDLARGFAYTRLSALERQAGDLDRAWTSLQRALTTLDGPPSPEPGPRQPALFDIETPPADDWRDKAGALDLIEEHFLLARSAADSGNPALAHQSLITGTALLDTVHRTPPALYRAAHAAARACGDGDLTARFGELLAQEEQRIAEFPYDPGGNSD
ncbi:hypothetical protein H1V43_04135 [Streptomyces sp. PSKA54]|uniref:Uncharacterized protein n=1 Tax=Streptomyces himalayensis subsp. aureolus TaxID=2758039 RepID=A0A7W2HE89_9ACTN|nr:hypothetical protein [Streptomyces himalayensis]MBA4860580.1 hypothetical protein [Streptomyces himalayensis subsp. aureolus]